MAKHLISQNIISVTELRRNLTAIFRQLPKRREPTIIQSSGAPVAVILSMAEYEQLVTRKRRRESLAAFHDFARNLGKEVERRGLTEEELLADLEKTKRKVFKERYGRLN